MSNKRGIIFIILSLVLVMPFISSVSIGDGGFILPPQPFPLGMVCSCSATTSGYGGSIDVSECYKAYDGDLDTYVGGPGYYYNSPFKYSYTYTLTLEFDKVEINNIEIIPGACFYKGIVYVYNGGVLKKTFSLYSSGNMLSFENTLADKVVVKWNGATNCDFSNIKEVKIKKLLESECFDSDGGVVKEEYINGTAIGYYETSETDQCYSTFFIYKHDRKDYSVWESNACKVGDPAAYAYIVSCTIKEAYCENGLAKKEDITCESGICYNGACGCEFDGDCAPGYICVNVNYTKPAGGEGELGACKLISCNDTDDGKDANHSGKVTSEINQKTGIKDICVNSNTVREYYCSLGLAQSQDMVCAPGRICKETTTGGVTAGACVLVNCGDGLKELGEECDDGNTIKEDGCSDICTIETCEDFKSNTTCFQFSDVSPQDEEMNCTWTPPGTISNPEGGCCPKNLPVWNQRLNICAEAGSSPCTIPFTLTIANALKTGGRPAAIDVINQELGRSISDIDYEDGPLDISSKKYCSQVSKELNWGLWYPTTAY